MCKQYMIGGDGDCAPVGMISTRRWGEGGGGGGGGVVKQANSAHGLWFQYAINDTTGGMADVS